MGTTKRSDLLWETSEPAMLEVLHAAGIVAATQVTVLILGESGTGKELLADAVHARSPRHHGPFVSVNCAALPDSLAESLLFGHRRGAFTDAQQSHDGYIRAAQGGTLFLDEIGELSSTAQAKLLRFLESGEVLPVGESLPRRVDVRIVAATHRDLAQLVAEGRFRDDLYFRLYVVPLHIPPLRERRGDIPALARRFLDELGAHHGNLPARLDSAAMGTLQRYAWPGNVRELRNLCERLAVLMPGRMLGVNNLPAEVRTPGMSPPSAVRLPSNGLVLADVERDLIRQAMERTGGNRSRAARLLGLTRDTLLYRLKKFMLE